MSSQTYIESEDVKFSEQLIKFYSRLGAYASILGVTSAEETSAKNDALFFQYIINWMGVNRDFSSGSTTYKDLARHGNGTEVMGDVPTTPVPAVPPTLVDANIQKRFSDLVARIKKSPNYTTAIGDDLGITTANSSFVPSDGKPDLSIKLGDGGFPQIKFTLSQYDGIQLLKDNGTSGFTLLNVVLHPTYADKSGMPGPGKTAIFSYKAIYLYKGEVVGQWSDVVSITVTG